MTRRAARFGVTARGALAFACLAALLALVAALPLHERGVVTAPGRVVVLVDVSDSVRGPRPDHSLWVRAELEREAARAADEGREITVATFASRVAELVAPVGGAELVARLRGEGAARALDPRPAPGEGARTDLAAALEWARERLRADATRGAGRLVLLGDGEYDGASPAPILGSIAARSVEWREPPPRVLGDVALLDLVLHADGPRGSPLVADVEVAVEGFPRSPPEVVHVELALTHGERTERSVHAIELAGAGERRVAIDLGAHPGGLLRLSARVVPPQGRGPDALPGNDRREVEGASGDLVRLGVSAAERVRPRIGAWTDPGRLRALGFAVEWIEPRAIAGRLGTLDALVTFGLGPGDLPQERIESFVERGGGWFGSFDVELLELERGGPLARIAPLVPAPIERPPRDVVLLVDASGSMRGEPYRALEAAVTSLLAAVPAGDAVSVRFFTGVLLPPVALDAREGRARAAQRLLASRPPSGPTALLQSVETFVADRVRTPRPALAFLLTDGLEEGDPVRPEERAAAVVSTLAELGVEFVALAIGPERRLDTLEPLAPGRVVDVELDRIGELPELLTNEVAAERFDHRATELAFEFSGPLAAAVAGGSRPPGPLARRLPARPTDGAEVFLVDADGGAVGAVARRGAGRALALAGGPFEGVADASAFAPERFGRALAFVADAPRAAVRARVASAPSGPRLEIAPVPTSASAALPARLVDPASGRVLAELVLEPPSGPLGTSRRSAPWPPIDAPAGATLHLELPALDGPPVALVAPLPPDHRPARERRRLAPRDLPPPVEAEAGARGPHPAAPFFALAAFGALVTALLSRAGERRRAAVKPGAPALR